MLLSYGPGTLHGDGACKAGMGVATGCGHPRVTWTIFSAVQYDINIGRGSVRHATK